MNSNDLNEQQSADEKAAYAQTVKNWVKNTLTKGVYELVDQGVCDEMLVEAKPAWILPESLLIGKIRNKGSSASSRWFICGDCETTHTPEEMAASPRAAARHFALSWQAKLGEQLNVDNPEHKTQLEQAEALYELSQVDEFWNHKLI
jgi:hypothetical protein